MRSQTLVPGCRGAGVGPAVILRAFIFISLLHYFSPSTALQNRGGGGGWGWGWSKVNGESQGSLCAETGRDVWRLRAPPW